MTIRQMVITFARIPFRDFLGSEYAKAIRELVDVRSTDGKSRAAIKETEQQLFGGL